MSVELLPQGSALQYAAVLVINLGNRHGLYVMPRRRRCSSLRQRNTCISPSTVDPIPRSMPPIGNARRFCLEYVQPIRSSTIG